MASKKDIIRYLQVVIILQKYLFSHGRYIDDKKY